MDERIDARMDEYIIHPSAHHPLDIQRKISAPDGLRGLLLVCPVFYVWSAIRTYWHGKSKRKKMRKKWNKKPGQTERIIIGNFFPFR